MATQLATSVDKSGKAWQQQQVAGHTVHSAQLQLHLPFGRGTHRAVTEWRGRFRVTWPECVISHLHKKREKNYNVAKTMCCNLLQVRDLRLCCIISNVRFPTAIGNLHTPKGSRQQDVRLKGKQSPHSVRCKYLCSTFWRAKINFTTKLCVCTLCVCVCVYNTCLLSFAVASCRHVTCVCCAEPPTLRKQHLPPSCWSSCPSRSSSHASETGLHSFIHSFISASGIHWNSLGCFLAALFAN